jgi:hypothetical protein
VEVLAPHHGQYHSTPYSISLKFICGVSFFENKGAVAGVFLIVGLSAASIVLFLFFFIKRRRRTRRLEYDTAVASTLAAAGFNRTPLDGDEEDGRAMSQRRGSNVSAFHSTNTMPSAHYTDEPPVMAATAAAAGAGMSGRAGMQDFDPYAAYGTAPPRSPSGSSRRDGYAPARTSSPPLGHSHNGSQSSAMLGGMGHMPRRESAGSFEPLLAAAGMSMPPTPSTLEPSAVLAPPIPPKSPRRLGGSSEEGGQNAAKRDTASSVYSNDEADDQLVDLLPRPLEVSVCDT